MGRERLSPLTTLDGTNAVLRGNNKHKRKHSGSDKLKATAWQRTSHTYTYMYIYIYTHIQHTQTYTCTHTRPHLYHLDGGHGHDEGAGQHRQSLQARPAHGVVGVVPRHVPTKGGGEEAREAERQRAERGGLSAHSLIYW